MPVVISGVLKDGTGKPVQGCTVTLTARKNTATVIVNTVASENPDEAGRYSMNVEPGRYSVSLFTEGYPPSRVGDITVYEDSLPGTLNDFLGAVSEDDVRPDALKRFEDMVAEVTRQTDEASRNATAAGQASGKAQTSADQAAESATAAANVAGAAAASATQAASSAAFAENSAGTATTKAGGHQPARRRLTQPERRQPHRPLQRKHLKRMQMPSVLPPAILLMPAQPPAQQLQPPQHRKYPVRQPHQRPVRHWQHKAVALPETLQPDPKMRRNGLKILLPQYIWKMPA